MDSEQNELNTTYNEICRTIKEEATEGESPGYWGALSDPQYRWATIICCIMAVCVQGTGINAVNLYSTKIYTNIQEQGGGGISPPVGTVLNNTAQMVGCLLSPFASYLNFRKIIVGGFLTMSLAMGLVALLAYLEDNTLLVVGIMIFVAIFQFTIGPYTWVYLGQVACDEGLSIATFFLWLGVFFLSIYTNTMFDKMEAWGAFLFFAAVTLGSFIFFFFTLKETKGMPRDQQQVVYSAKKPLKNSTATREDKESLMGNRALIGNKNKVQADSTMSMDSQPAGPYSM